MAFPDESSKTGVWRVMPVDDFPAWLAAQSRVPASIRYIVDHHTWSPASATQSPSGFLAQVKGIFRNYYEVPTSRGGRGWERDHGPQFHLGLIGGKAYLVIAANLSVHGPHCAYFNACSVGIETYINGDRAPWPEEMLRGLYVVHAAFRDRLGIPLKRGVTGPIDTNVPTQTGTGWLFHRDAKKSDKSCPGWLNTHAMLQAAFDRNDCEEDEMTAYDRTLLEEAVYYGKLARVSDVARSHDVEILKAMVGGEAPESIDALEAEKAEAIRKVKVALGLLEEDDADEGG